MPDPVFCPVSLPGPARQPLHPRSAGEGAEARGSAHAYLGGTGPCRSPRSGGCARVCRSSCRSGGRAECVTLLVTGPSCLPRRPGPRGEEVSLGCWGLCSLLVLLHFLNALRGLRSRDFTSGVWEGTERQRRTHTQDLHNHEEGVSEDTLLLGSLGICYALLTPRSPRSRHSPNCVVLKFPYATPQASFVTPTE